MQASGAENIFRQHPPLLRVHGGLQQGQNVTLSRPLGMKLYFSSTGSEQKASELGGSSTTPSVFHHIRRRESTVAGKTGKWFLV
jgi:hypothetical protein